MEWRREDSSAKILSHSGSSLCHSLSAQSRTRTREAYWSKVASVVPLTGVSGSLKKRKDKLWLRHCILGTTYIAIADELAGDETKEGREALHVTPQHIICRGRPASRDSRQPGERTLVQVSGNLELKLDCQIGDGGGGGGGGVHFIGVEPYRQEPTTWRGGWVVVKEKGTGLIPG